MNFYSCASVSGSEFYDETSMDMEADGKRKNRNLSEKKRRDQFNILINELGSMVECNIASSSTTSSSKENKQQQPSQSHVGIVSSSSASPCPPNSSETSSIAPSYKSSKSSSSSNANKKLDKSTILRATIEFLKARKAESKKRQEKNKDKKEETNNKDEECEEVFQAWKPSYLSHDEFAHLMMEVSKTHCCLLICLNCFSNILELFSVVFTSCALQLVVSTVVLESSHY